jgi:hypothetical protein
LTNLIKGTSDPNGDSCQEDCPVIWLKWRLTRKLVLFYTSNNILAENYAHVSMCST